MMVPGGNFLHFWQPALSHWAHTQIPMGLRAFSGSFFFFFCVGLFALPPRAIFRSSKLYKPCWCYRLSMPNALLYSCLVRTNSKNLKPCNRFIVSHFHHELYNWLVLVLGNIQMLCFRQAFLGDQLVSKPSVYVRLAIKYQRILKLAMG